ncbi:MAG: hypothetical protein IM333_07030 [Microcystis sp. M048S1]|uniref:hypothetical protein n=1 Tax=unclassified Microcystis TaxID=2643300 RepID=UPI001192AA79|nr:MULTISPECIES: hypothetical protein [unclassified Microcystis]MCA2902623.1 hypothetical protein [Microcystis sp. M035S1]MCA2721279.1 hypothetical protein [Microcystis sp. M176S2]MCA2727347.1 hypothetical protein [Microcystis sp. M166S2]MCA2732151.1 hypothetical protein [Microcystis sp. M162S2]MCA2746060.1 hypothetical protein [Microcystis sp. M155S2]
MQSIKKQFVTDKNLKPVAVIIDDQDWQKIEALLQESEQEDSTESFKALAAYAGSIQLTIDPLEYQSEIRNS